LRGKSKIRRRRCRDEAGPADMICFIIAANDEQRGPGITDHLRTAWGVLKEISDLAANDDEDVRMGESAPSSFVRKQQIIFLIPRKIIR
jgi:hypothetical protein